MAERSEAPVVSSSQASNVLTTKLDPTSAKFEANMRFLADLMSQVRNEGEKICEGGGVKAIENQHNKGRLTARERIELLADPGTFFELGLYAAHGMYEEWGGAPAAGVITGMARIHTRLVMIIANDATVKAGAFFPMTSKKVIRAQNIAIENRIPTIYLVDSSGVFLPLQEDVFPDTDDFGRVFRNNAVMSALGIPQIAAIMGMCVAGGGYLPVMCDHVLMTDGSGLFLAGPALVQAAIGQKVSAEDLGGAAMHSSISGTVDFREPDDQSCLARIRSIIEKWGYRRQSPWDRKKPVEPAMAAEEIYGIYDSSPARPYDMKEILARVLDGSRFDEYKPEYGKTLICGYGAHRRLRRGHSRQPEAACAGDRPRRPQAHRIWRRHLHRVGRKSRPLHHGLQSEFNPADFFPRCERFHGGPRRGMERHHQSRRKDGECGIEFRGAKDYRDRGWIVWRWTLCHVWQGV